MAAILKIQIYFLHFSLLLIAFMPMKLGSEIARRFEHLGKYQYDLKQPWPWKMVAILKIKTSYFCTFLHDYRIYSYFIPTKLGRDIARGKGHFVWEYDLNAKFCWNKYYSWGEKCKNVIFWPIKCPPFCKVKIFLGHIPRQGAPYP